MKYAILILLLIHLSLGQIDDKIFKWGTYKPQLIHGITERNPQTGNPLTVTFYYFLNSKLRNENDIRFKVPETNNKQIYNFQVHDGERYAYHQIRDTDLDVKLSNEFIKIAPDVYDDWVSTVQNNNALEGDTDEVSLVYSIALEKLNSQQSDLRRITVKEDGNSLRFSIQDSNSSTSYIYVNLMVNGEVVPIPENANIGLYLGNQDPQKNYDCRNLLYWELKKLRVRDNQVANKLEYSYQKDKFGNVAFIQYVGHNNENFSFQIRYAQKKLTYTKSGYYFENKLLKRQLLTNFESKFKKSFFENRQAPNPFHMECAKSAFSNLMGGYILAYGDLLCEGNEAPCTEERMMLTMTPSRKGFPRPFLWDDGFHNMIACRWNPQLCLQTLSDWFGTMTDDGWIPREQARGVELKKYFPSDFTAEMTRQRRRETNPPTFLFDFLKIKDLSSEMPELDLQMEKLWPKLVTWFEFWTKSQGVFENDNPTNLFKWWGPNENQNWGSGMDDWPRTISGFNGKYNIDASIWGWFFADSMEKLSSKYDPERNGYYKNKQEAIKKAINEHLLDPTDHLYKDLLIGRYDTLKHSPHLGYPNLLPLAFGFIEDENVLNAQLDLLQSEKLWTEYGIRSLSNTDENFGHGDNYWRGPIWIPINYLLLRGLSKYYKNNERAIEIQSELRKNIINTVCSNWQQTGYFFEHYNQKRDGKGGGNFPFNGWTSLITLIIGQNYD